MLVRYNNCFVDFRWKKKACCLLIVCARVDVYSHKVVVFTTLGTHDRILSGFDECGNVKLFDFGLARELSLADRDENGMYLLTAETGSPRYMDPIIVGYGKSLSEKERYNELVDVYSFCIFLWQMLALEAPYACYQTFSSFHKKVVSGGVRPRCHEAWPSSLCSMMRLGWGDIRCRLPMKNITSELQRQLGESPDPSNSEKSNLAVVSSSTGQLEAMLRQMGIGDEKDAETASISAYSDEGNLEEQSEAHKQEPTSFLSVALDACCFSCCPLQTKQP